MRILVFVLVLAAVIPAVGQSAEATHIFAEAARLAKSGDFHAALVRYGLILDRPADTPLSPTLRARVHYNLGVCEYRLGRIERAVVELHAAIALRGGDYPQALYALGMAESARDNWPNARAAFTRALLHDTRNAEAWFDLACVHVAEKNFMEAETAFRNAIAHGSVDSAFGYNNIGVILATRGDLASAKKAFETAYRVSGGRLKMAADNLLFCESYEKSADSELFAWSRRSPITEKSYE